MSSENEDVDMDNTGEDAEDKVIVSDDDDDDAAANPVDNDMVNDEEDDDEEDPMSHDDLIELLNELSSSRPDSIQSKKRNELIEQVTNACKIKEDCQQILSEWKGTCSSSHAYRRIGIIMTTSVSQKNQDQNTTIKLCEQLCSLLYSFGDADFIDVCITSLVSNSKDNDLLGPIFHQIALDNQTISQSKLLIPAIVLGSAITNGSNNQVDWCNILLQFTLTKFSDASDMLLARTFLQNRISSTLWNTIISPALQLKAKSHPDKALQTIVGWLDHLGADVATEIDDEWITILIKHLISAKDDNPSMASKICIGWSRQSIVCSEKILSALVTKAKPTLAPARVMVYETLHSIGSLYTSSGVTVKPNDMTIKDVLEGLVTFLKKEPKTEHRASGLQAVATWMVIAKRAKSENTGYRLVVDEFVQQPIITKKMTDAGVLLFMLVKSVHPDLLESIATDLWDFGNGKESAAKVKLWEKSLDAAIEMASTKKTLQVEGLLILYCTLLYADHASTPVPAFCAKAIAAGAAKKENASFVYSQSMLDALTSSDVVGLVLPRVIATYTKLAGSSSSLTKLFPKSKLTAACRAVAFCCIHPTTNDISSQKISKTNDQLASNAVIAALQIILTYEPCAAEALAQTLFQETNARALQFQVRVKGMNDSRESREMDTNDFPMKGQGSANATHSGFDANAVRRSARIFSRHLPSIYMLPILTRVLVLMHAGTSLKSEGHQRAALILNTLGVFRDFIVPHTDDHTALRKTIAQEIVNLATRNGYIFSTDGSENGSEESKQNNQNAIAVSDSLQKASIGLIVSLGAIASNYQDDGLDEGKDEDTAPYKFVSILCKKDISELLAIRLNETFEVVEALTVRDMDIFLTPCGTLLRESTTSNTPAQETKKTNMKYLNEDEQWEIQMKKELEEKKKQNSTSDGTLSEEDKKLLAHQDNERRRITGVLKGDLLRSLEAIQYLCSSDIEVGNSCLQIVSESVLRSTVSRCPAISMYRPIQEKSMETLVTLATCVYEILEVHAPTMATALAISCRYDSSTSDDLSHNSMQGKQADRHVVKVSPLPSPCAPAACVVFEMENFHDTLSGASFAFLFPVIQACLLGIRTIVGCEGALGILSLHTELLYGEKRDPIVINLRKDMVIAVLELLKYDRAMAFHDPTPFEALVDCFQTSETPSGAPLSAGEIAPLLDERGALGTAHCRIASLRAIASIAETHRKFVKMNPLIENRVWLNCFEKAEPIRLEARKTWSVIHDVSDSFNDDDLSSVPRPSPVYAAPFLPLLSHSDLAIAEAAASAYAFAMGMHPNSVSRNIETLCKAYIDSFPSPEIGEASTGVSLKAKAAPTATVVLPTKKPIITGLPKKKTVPVKSALEIIGTGKPKVIKKKTAQHSELLKPKQERTLDQEQIDNMFKTGPASAKVPEEKDSPAKQAVRNGVIRTISSLSNLSIKLALDEATLKLLTSFLMAYGIADSNPDVKGAARNALRDIVASNGGSDEAIAFLLTHLEVVLKTGVADESSLGSLSKEKVPKDISASDRRKEGAVVALGSVALHLHGVENDGKVDDTVDMLIAALKTPSQEVQESVADALTKLMKKGRTSERIETILNSLLHDCLHGNSLAARRGSAYGLSAVVKGSGIMVLKKYEIVKRLEESCSNGSANSKEGALFAIELLSNRLGLLFEPYVITLLPSLLRSFSDGSDHVRSAANNTTSLIMSKLSAHGVKLVMPAVLTAFDDPAWRTKQASIRMLGAMSHLAPKQLASALPKVVPKLTEAFSDTHPKVKMTAQEALNEISTVIKNPEVSGLSAVLLKALTDPADYTVKALEALIQTEFLHAIDAPSLALIVPILHRGLRDRGAATKRYGGLIAGNICAMINDPKDFIPYLPTLLPDMQTALLDPIPDVRSTSAKALGSLTRSLGDQILPELRPWLVKKLRDGTCSSAERSGAAQGLTEVLIASGSDKTEEVMRNEILPLRSHPEFATREGVLWMLTFLPPALGQGFTPLIDVSLPALIRGLSDDSEPVRDVAMRAGRVLIRSHGKAHIDKILPSLEAGLTDGDYRIRVASLSLLGDLLSMIGGTQVVRGEGDTQDDIRKAERAQAQIALALGSETRRRVLSGLYLARSDTVFLVRQSALQVWKTVVSVTARTLRDILPVLVSKIIEDLASGDEEKTEVAGRCLGDLVGKLGDSVLPQIMPVLRNALNDTNEHTKRGVCVGLTEVINCSTKEQIFKYIEIITKVVQDALSDDNESVRRMAATSFQSLHNVVGSRALDEVVPSLMVALERGDHDEKARSRALNGLSGILSVRSRELLPYIIPKLISRPMSTNHAKALTGIAAVTGGTIQYHFSSIMPVLLGELADSDVSDAERFESIVTCAQTICGSVDAAGVSILIGEIASKSGSDKASLRAACCRMFDFVVTKRAEKEDFYEQIPIIIRELVYRLNDDNAVVLKAVNEAFTSLSKYVPAQELVKHVEFMRNLLASMVSEARRRKGGVGDGEFLLPGFNMPKGVEPLIPIFQQGVLYGNPQVREACAAGLGEVIGYTSDKFLTGPLIVKMTGPLLRIVGDRNPSNVKVAILKTLGLVLVKGGPALRAFVPQFQTTFVKALADPSRQVRGEAIHALSVLMPLTTRVDPLIKELVSASLGKTVTEDGIAAYAVQTASLDALATVLEKGGEKAKLPTSLSSSLDCSKELLSSVDPGIRESAAKVMGACCSLLGAEETKQLIQTHILISTSNDTSERRHANFCAMRRILSSNVGSLLDESTLAEIKKAATGSLNDDKESVRVAGCIALGAVIGRSTDPKSSLRRSEADLLKIMNNGRETIDIHRAVAKGFCVGLLMIDQEKRVDFMGITMLDSCLQLSLNSNQRVQMAFHEVLWLALDVSTGNAGLEKYCALALFDNQRSMKSLHSKVLGRIKELSIFEG